MIRIFNFSYFFKNTIIIQAFLYILKKFNPIHNITQKIYLVNYSNQTQNNLQWQIIHIKNKREAWNGFQTPLSKINQKQNHPSHV